MKKNMILFFVIALMLSNLPNVVAVTNDSSPSASVATSSATSEDKDIKNIKEKLASITRKKDQKAFAGFATVKDGVITLTDNESKDFTVKTDDSLTTIYQIAGAIKKEIKKSDIKTDKYLIVTGPIVDQTINANVVFIDDAYIVQSGKITEINKSDFTIKAISQDKEIYTLDIESSTKQNMVNPKTLEIEKTGFSKIKEGDIVHFAAVKDKSDQSSTNHFAAQKILIVPQEYFIK